MNTASNQSHLSLTFDIHLDELDDGFGFGLSAFFILDPIELNLPLELELELEPLELELELLELELELLELELELLELELEPPVLLFA